MSSLQLCFERRVDDERRPAESDSMTTLEELTYFRRVQRLAGEVQLRVRHPQRRVVDVLWTKRSGKSKI